MKKVLAILALALFIGGISAPVIAANSNALTVIALNEEDPKKKDTNTEKSTEATEKSTEATEKSTEATKKSSDCSGEKKSSDCSTEKKSDCKK
jgi:uncharacterized protein YxeA